MSVPVVWPPLDNRIFPSSVTSLCLERCFRVGEIESAVKPFKSSLFTINPSGVVVIILCSWWRFSKYHSGSLLESIPGVNTLIGMTIALIVRHGVMVVVLSITGVQ